VTQLPNKIRAGDTIKWRVDASRDNLGNSIDSGSWSLVYYFRTNTNNEGHTATGTAFGLGWEFTISASDSDGFDAGDWFFQSIATKDSESVTLATGQIEVLAGLDYTGDSPSAFDGRTQAEKDLAAVQKAIRDIANGNTVKSYSVAGRSLTRYEMSDLIALESKLKFEVQRERRAALIANGKGDPFNLFVRF
jgi:hypothetical protein